MLIDVQALPIDYWSHVHLFAEEMTDHPISFTVDVWPNSRVPTVFFILLDRSYKSVTTQIFHVDGLALNSKHWMKISPHWKSKQVRIP